MDEIYETEVWKRLEKNALFKEKFDEIIKRICWYIPRDEIKIKINGNKLVLGYRSKPIDRENNCQFCNEAKYEMQIDSNNNLVVNEMFGSLHSNYGYDFKNTKGGILYTDYSCQVYDEDGIELANQIYGDSFTLKEFEFDIYKNSFIEAIENGLNPELSKHINSIGTPIHARVIGTEPKFRSVMRSKNDLGIIICTSCEFNRDGSIINQKEDYYFNTFISHQATFNPTSINGLGGVPFATRDNEKMMFTKLYTNSGLTASNYKEIANDRFLRELLDEKKSNSSNAPKIILDKFDLMINRLTSREGKERTR